MHAWHAPRNWHCSMGTTPLRSTMRNVLQQAAPNDPQLWFLLGYAARLNGRYQQSVDAYTRGLRMSPSSPEGLSGLAQDYSLMGRTEEAERLLKAGDLVRSEA